LLTGDPKVAARAKVVEKLQADLARFGAFDKMRHTMAVAVNYDALIDSPMVSADARPVLRARLAYLAYVLADPTTWSPERGYCSGNPNMTVAHVLNAGYLGCTIPDHPLARVWAQPAMALMERALEELGPEGEHRESVANYAGVSGASMLCFAIAARNAGLHDYVNDPRMKKLMLYLAKQYTPPDLRGDAKKGFTPGLSRLPGAGRGPAGQRLALPGMMAKATASSDPEYSRTQQWVWQRAGYPVFIANQMLGGYEYVYMDRDLPAARPDWGTDFFPEYGVIFRQGLGTPDEWYMNFQVKMWDGVPSANGSFAALFAKGAPLSALFSKGWADRDELVVSRVLPARRRGTPEERYDHFYHTQEAELAGHSALPRQDYAAADIVIGDWAPRMQVGGSGKANPDFDQLMTVRLPEWPPIPAAGNFPILWTRQVLFVKDDDPAGAGYLLLRDTVSGGQPTIWQFWTLSEKIGTPEEARNPEAFLADKPGDKVVEPRELKGDRFTALGPFGVDLEYYLASPTATPRYTLRGGTTYDQWERRGGVPEYQDLLHLQMPGDGAYFVALFPRRRGEPVPSFEALGNGMIIKVSGEFGTDHGFLSGAEAEAAAGDVRFKGTAGSVQDRPSGLVLSLGAKGEVRYKAYGLTAGFAASLRAGEKTLTIEIQDKVTDGDKTRAPQVPFRGGTVTITAPGEWAPAKPLPGVELAKTAAGWTLTVPAGVRSVQLSNR
jgi:hypothetical protein